MGAIKPKYDFYENERFLDDPIEADHARQARCCAPKIGTEPKMPSHNLEKTPGPQYYPGDRPEKVKPAKYTFGYRRDKGTQNVLTNHISTPAAVGPGRYAPEKCVDPST